MDFLACSPFYVVMRLHLWRLLTACLCPDSLLSAIVGLLLLYRYGLMLEQERGTLLFVSSCSIKVVAMNALLCLGSVLLSPVAPSLMSPLHAARGGLFPLMLALMTTQSQRGAQAGARTSFFGVFSVPTTHFPLLLLALFVLLGAHPLETSAAVGVGYLKHWGKLDRFEPSLETLTRVEALPWMEAVSRWRGFVPMSSAGATLPAYTVTNNNSNNNNDPNSAGASGLASIFGLRSGAVASAGTRSTVFAGRGQTLGGTGDRLSPALPRPTRASGPAHAQPPPRSLDGGAGGFSDTSYTTMASLPGVPRLPERATESSARSTPAAASATPQAPVHRPSSGFPPSRTLGSVWSRVSGGSEASRAVETPSREARAAAFLIAHEQRLGMAAGATLGASLPAQAAHAFSSPPASTGSAATEGSIAQQPGNDSVGNADANLQEQINLLGDMGFPSNKAIRALRLARGDTQAAAEMILSGLV